MSKGKIKSTIRDLSRKSATDQEFDEITKLLFANPPPAPVVAPVLGQVVAEDTLESLIRQSLARTDDKTWRDMTGENGPLKTFYSKIILAYALGIIEENTKANLNIIRNIRNAFAHSRHILSFDNDLIRAEIKGVKLPDLLPDTYSSKALKAVESGATGQLAYVALCYAVSGVMLQTVHELRGRHITAMVARDAKSQGSQSQSSQNHQSDDPTPLAIPLVDPTGEEK